MPADRNKNRSKSRERKQKEAEDEALAAEEAEEARKRAAEEESEAAKKLPPDIMNQKGYYDMLMKQMEDMAKEMKDMDEDIEKTEAEKNELEQKIKVLQQWLADYEKPHLTKKENLIKLDRMLAELEDPNADPEMLARKVHFMNLPLDPLERAGVLRRSFMELIYAGGQAPLAPYSVTPRHGCGVEAVESHNFATSREYGSVPVRCYSPAGRRFDSSPAPPAIVFFHGGGYVVGDLDTHDGLCRSLCGLSGSTVVSVDYRRAPEHKYPAAFEDAYAAVLWVSRGGLGQIPKRIGVAGDDAGAGLAAACCLRAKDDPEGPSICLQILASPWLDLRPSASSMSHQYNDGKHGLSYWECDWYREVYAPEGTDPESKGGGPWTEEIGASPFLAESLAGLPRTFIVYPVHSMMSGEAVEFVERFRAEVGFEYVHPMRVEGPKHHFLALPDDNQAQHVVSAVATFASAVLWAP